MVSIQDTIFSVRSLTNEFGLILREMMKTLLYNTIFVTYSDFLLLFSYVLNQRIEFNIYRFLIGNTTIYLQLLSYVL